MRAAPSRTPQLRRTRLMLAGVFVLVVAAVVAVIVGVVASISAPLRALRTIEDEHAKAVQAATRMRSSMSVARRMLVADVSSGAAAASARAEPHRVRYGALQQAAAELDPLCDTAFEKRQLDALRTALARSASESDMIDQRLRRGDRQGALERVGGFLEATSQANEAVDAIAEFNAGQVRDSSARIQASLRRLTVALAAAACGVAVGAWILLRFALRGLAAYQASWDVRYAELDAFASRVAHELRTPLQTLMLSLASKAPDAAVRTRRGLDRMQRTIEALLQFSRAGTPPEGDAASDVRQAVVDVEEELAREIADRQARIEVIIRTHVPVPMALEHLRTILRNLVANAIRHSPPGVRITIAASLERGRVHVTVSDDGPGIPPAALPHVFEPFTRATTEPGGFGVGLATVRRLVESHGGGVRVTSREGHGTTVHLELREGQHVTR